MSLSLMNVRVMDARRSDSSLISDISKLKRSLKGSFGSLCRGPILGERGTREELTEKKEKKKREKRKKSKREKKIVSWSEARERFDGASCIYLTFNTPLIGRLPV